MDPITVVGTTSAVIGIVGLIAKAIKSLNELRGRWKDADLTIVNLVSQLISLRAALNKISEWISSDLADVPQHHQLVLDLEQAISYCHVLMQSVDSQISRNDDNSPDSNSRIRSILEGKACGDFQKFIERQTSALSLLLTACNCKTLSEQKTLLESSSNRDAFNRIRDDSSSLIVLYDTVSLTSHLTQSSGVSSGLSRIFPFDTDLMKSHVYQRATRSLFKSSLRRAKGKENAGDQQTPLQQILSLTRKEKAVQSKSTGLTFGEDELSKNKEVELALLGMPGGAIYSFSMLLRRLTCSRKMAPAELKCGSARKDILDILIESLLAFLDEVQSYHYEKNQSQLLQHFQSQIESFPRASRDARTAIKAKWEHIQDDIRNSQVITMQICMRQVASLIDPLPIYFLNNLDTILDEDYVPSALDIEQLPVFKSLQQFDFRAGALKLKILNPGPPKGVWQEWADQFETTHGIVFLADLNSYIEHEAYRGGSAPMSTGMESSIAFFQNTVNSQPFRSKPVILCLYDHEDLFEHNLRISPMSKIFPDYYGGDDVDKAAAYVAEMFFQAMDEDRSSREIYWQIVESKGDDLVCNVLASVECIRIKNIRSN